ncbi:MAG: hypothetical protein JXA78_19775 [Anaerolineales bacterium]|nr:hypothetical protein [Anaerolineales bacterium]
MDNPNGPYLLGSDLGTSSCKSIIIDSRGAICGWATKDYATLRLHPGWAEQDPQAWYQAFCETVRQAIERSQVDPAEIVMVSIVGVTHNAVLLDEHGQALRPSILYTDTRSASQADDLLHRWGGRVFERTWNQLSPLWTWPQLEWLRQQEQETWGRVRRILFPKDYVRNRVAPSFVSDTIDPAGSLLYDPCRGEWIAEFYQSLGLSQDVFPEIRSPWEIVGGVCQEAASATGLAPGTNVIAGTTDTAAEVFGVGALHPGQATIKLATVGRITAISEKPIDNPSFLNYPHVLEGLWYPGTATKFAASAFTWARKAFWDDGESAYDYQLMDRAAESIPPGSSGVLFHPYLAGEFAPAWDPYLRGSYLGVSVDHTRAHFTRAVMEGVGFAIREALESVIRMGLEVDEIRLLGGGTESRLWAQIITDIVGREAILPVGTDAAYGAALMAGVAAGIFDKTQESIDALIKFQARLYPDSARVALYNDLFEIYQQAASLLKEISHKLHRFQTKFSSIV